MSTMDLFTRLAESHKPDCILSLEGPAPEAVPDPEILAGVLGSDAAGRYAAACRPVYEDLRRIIGQLSGLLILARLTARTEVTDLPEIERCRVRWADAQRRLQALSAPVGLSRHKAQLESAHAFSGDVLHAFSDLRPAADLTAPLDRMSLLIKRAYAHLEAAGSQKARLQMVDFSHACCSCASSHETADTQ